MNSNVLKKESKMEVIKVEGYWILGVLSRYLQYYVGLCVIAWIEFPSIGVSSVCFTLLLQIWRVF